MGDPAMEFRFTNVPLSFDWNHLKELRTQEFLGENKLDSSVLLYYKKNKSFENPINILIIKIHEDYEIRLSSFNALEIESFIKLIQEIFSLCNCSGYGYHPRDFDEVGGYLQKEKDPLKISSIWSVHVFNKKDVEKYDRDKLLKSPCDRIEEWEDGSLFISIEKEFFGTSFERLQNLRKYLGVKLPKLTGD